MSENFTFIVLEINRHSFQKCVWHWKTNYWCWGGFLCILHVGHDLEISFTSLISSLLLHHKEPALVMSWSNFSSFGWTNWRCSFRAKCFSDFVSVTVKLVHVIAFRVLYLLLVFFTEVVHILAKPFITINSRASSTIKKYWTPCFWHDKFELLGVVIIDLVKHNLIDDVFVVVMGTCLDTFVPNNLFFGKLHILFVFHIYQGVLRWGFVKRLGVACFDWLCLGWKGYDLD